MLIDNNDGFTEFPNFPHDDVGNVFFLPGV